MIKKIICPLDFSDVAVNATVHAAKLAQTFNVELVLFNAYEFEPVPVSWSVLEGKSIGSRDRAAKISSRMQETAHKLSERYKITCNYEIEEKKKTLAETISSGSGGDTLIVMGTNGADNLYQLIFGSNTYRVIKKTTCPVLIVPEYCPFKAYKKILFTYNEKDNLELKFFNEFINPFRAEIDFLEICPVELQEEENYAVNREDGLNKLSGKRIAAEGKIYSEYSAEIIDEFLTDHPVDLLALQAMEETHKDKTFHGKLLKELCKIVSYPVLVLH